MTISKKTALIYCRVSTTKQQDDWDSLSNQEEACRKYCKNNNIQVVWVFKEAFSGNKRSRPIFDEAMNNAKENNITFFIVFDIDRFSREWYGAYSELKENLSNHWIQLKDSKNIIWEDNIVMKNDIVDMWQYKWNKENRSEMSEMVYSAQAKIELRKIIQRTITREIQLEQMAYKVRQSNFGYQNLKIKENFWKATIQIKHPIEWEWIQEIFEKRAKWNLTDQEIVDEVNLKWYKSRRGIILNIKQMHVYIKSPVYAWVISTKWTWYNAIRTPYKGLVDINTWNKANRWKIKIIEVDGKEVKIEYRSWKEIKMNQPIVKNRKGYNTNFCYSKVLTCPHCKADLTASSSTWWSGNIHHYYTCRGWRVNKHKAYNLKRDITNKEIVRTFRSIKVKKDVLKLYDEITDEVFNDRKNELQEETKDYKKYLKELDSKEKMILDDISKVIDYPLLLKLEYKKLEDIKEEKNKVEQKSTEIENTTSLEKFKHYSKQIIQHLDKLVIQKERPDLIKIAFEVLYNWSIEYDNLGHPTEIFTWLTSTLNQKKSSKIENFSKNRKWQSH